MCVLYVMRERKRRKKQTTLVAIRPPQADTGHFVWQRA